MINARNAEVSIESTDAKARESLYLETLAIYTRPPFAERYFEIWKNDIPGRKIDRFLSMLNKGSRILDAGCGPGHHANYIRRSGFHVFGIDLSTSALEIAKSNFAFVNFHRMNMLRTDFSQCHFDGIWSCASAVHLPPELFPLQLAEFHRLLKPAGILALTVSAGKREHLSPDGRYFYSFPNSTAIEMTLSLSGFSLIAAEDEILGKTTFGNPSLVGNWITLIAKKEPKNSKTQTT